MKFRNRTTGQDKRISPAGSKFKTTYSIEIDDNGHKTLSPTGETNIYEKIQLDLEECKIENILSRVALGDTNALNRVEGKFIDTTDMPRTLAEAQNSIIKLKQQFYSLPKETREKFDNSPEKYINDFGTESFLEALGLKKEEKVEPKVEPETKEEPKNE